MITLKYPIKIAGQLYSIGSRVRLATVEEMRKIWPGIMPERDSGQVGVWFSGRDLPCIVEKSQLEGLPADLNAERD